MIPEARQAALDRARTGDERALGELLESFRPYLAVVARGRRQGRLAGKVDDSDLIQDALLDAHRGFTSFRGATVEELAGWLRQIVARAAGRAVRDHLATAKRNAGREQPLAGLSSVVGGDGTTPSGQAMRHERAAQIATALAQLPEEMQAVILGRHIDDASYAELAERLGKSEAALRVVYTRAIRRLRDEFRSGASAIPG